MARLSPAPSLPGPLAPWATELSIFPRELALSLGTLVSRVAALIGPLRRDRHSGAGEVDGFDGLSRRGSYERLLATEWLLAEEAPDEFLRRAAGGEHAFLRLARPEPDSGRTSHALFDAGPSQLGTPRVVHIAALVVLARRAAAARTPFAWGILQDQRRRLSSDFTAADVVRLLDSRTPFEAHAADLAAWRKVLGPPSAADDLWLVGGERLDSLPGARDASRLVVTDVLDPRSRQVAAEVRRGSRERSPVVLNLPAADDTTRLLRDPFGSIVAGPLVIAPGAPRPASNLVFADNGLRLFARVAGGGAVDFPLPNSPRTAAGQPRVLRLQGSKPLIAIGRSRKGGVETVTRHEDGYRLHARRSDLAYPIPAGSRVPPPRDAGALGPLHHELGDILFRHDAFLVRLKLSTTRAVVVAPDVLDSAGVGGHGRAVVFLARGADGVVTLVRLGAGASRTELGRGERGWLGCGGPGGAVLAAVAESSGAVRVWDFSGTTLIRVPSDVTVIGVCRNERRNSGPGVLVLEGDGRTIVHVGPNWTRKLPRAGGPIDRTAVSAARPYVAWTTTKGELVVYSLDHEAAVLRSG